jgi:hypothetical protein
VSQSPPEVKNVNKKHAFSDLFFVSSSLLLPLLFLEIVVFEEEEVTKRSRRYDHEAMMVPARHDLKVSLNIRLFARKISFKILMALTFFRISFPLKLKHLLNHLV